MARAKKAEQDAAQAAAAAKARAAAAANRAAAAQSDADRSRFQATISAKGALPHKSTADAAKAHADQTAANAAAKAAHEEAQRAAMAEQAKQEAAAAAAREKAAAEQAKRAELAKPKEEAFVQATPDSVADASADSRPPTYGMGTEDSLAVVGDDGLPVYADTYAPGEDKILGISKTTLIVGSAIAVASMGVFFYLNRK
jgi:colicin import membrane protein